MTGAELKERLSTTHISLSEIARRMGIKPQDLNALFNVKDTKTGTLERLSQALDLPIAFFYGDSYNVTGTNIVNSGSNNAVHANDERLLNLLINKDEQLTMAMKQTSKAQAQMDDVLAMWKNSSIHNTEI